MSRTDDKILLWPRHEVLQLINPAIPQSGKVLSQGLTVEAVRQLAKMQSADNSISFQQWFLVARDLLRWNENFIRLFWDMLHTALWYLQKEEWSQHCDFVQFGYLVVFLVMHITSQSSSPARNNHAFESVWPPALENESPPTSPLSSQRKHTGNSPSSPSAPISPRSPRSPGGNTSPRKSLSPRLNTAASFVRSHTQHLTVLREKIPLLLYALSLQDNEPAEHNNLSGIPPPSPTASQKRQGEYFTDSGLSATEDSLRLSTASSNAFDTLCLLIGGGISKKQEVRSLSQLFSLRQAHENEQTSDPSFRCSALSEWVSSSLKLNDALYPPSPVYGSISPTSSSGGNSPRSPGADISAIHIPSPTTEIGCGNNSVPGNGGCMFETSVTIPPLQTGQPIRRVIPIESSHSREPTVIHGHGSTAFYILQVHGKDQNMDDSKSKLKSLGHLNDDDDSALEFIDDDVNETVERSHGSSQKSLASHLIQSERYGPVLICGCTRSNLYMLSPYTFASVSSCTDCEIVLGAVAGVVAVSGCERIQLTVACRKLILWNCRDCDIKVGTLTPTIVSGDCRGLSFGPFNTAYRHLRAHLRLAYLDALIGASKSKLANVDTNCWNEIFDINTCADSDPPTPRERSNSDDGSRGNENWLRHCSSLQFQAPAVASGLSCLPSPPDSVLSLLNAEKFSFLPISYAPEYQPQEMCPMMIPEPYVEAYMRQKQASASIRQDIQSTLDRIKKEKNIDCQETFDKMLSNQFLEWLVKTGKAPGMMDLIRLDAEDKTNQCENENGEFSRATMSSHSW